MMLMKPTVKLAGMLAAAPIIFLLYLAVQTGSADDNAAANGTKAEVKAAKEAGEDAGDEEKLKKVVKTEKEWRKQLTREQFRVARKHGTERAFRNAYWNNKRDGIYNCVCCGLELFDSKTKFKSGTGWPSFYQPISEKHVGKQEDRALFYVRTEVHCKRCDAHLGHVFDDAPSQPTGLRYCMNSAALKFVERDKPEKKKKARK